MKAQLIAYLLMLWHLIRQSLPHTPAEYAGAGLALLISWYLPRTKKYLANSILEGIGNILRSIPAIGDIIHTAIGTVPPAPPAITTTTTVNIASASPDPLPPLKPEDKDSK